jgi:hypothetical protein
MYLLPKLPTRNFMIFWLQIMLGGFCFILSLILLLPFLRIGEQSVTLKVTPITCGAITCNPDDWAQIEWVEPGMLRITSIVLVPITEEVESDTASVSTMGAVVHLKYVLKARDWDWDGEPGMIPAALIPVSLSFQVTGLPKQSYSVTTSGTIRFYVRIVFGFAMLLLVVALLLFAKAYIRSTARQAAVRLS